MYTQRWKDAKMTICSKNWNTSALNNRFLSNDCGSSLFNYHLDNVYGPGNSIFGAYKYSGGYNILNNINSMFVNKNGTPNIEAGLSMQLGVFGVNMLGGFINMGINSYKESKQANAPETLKANENSIDEQINAKNKELATENGKLNDLQVELNQLNASTGVAAAKTAAETAKTNYTNADALLTQYQQERGDKTTTKARQTELDELIGRQTKAVNDLKIAWETARKEYEQKNNRQIELNTKLKPEQEAKCNSIQKEIDALNKQKKAAKATLEDRELDIADGHRYQQTSENEFNDLFQNKQSLNFNTTKTANRKFSKNDIRRAIANFRAAATDTDKKFAQGRFNAIWEKLSTADKLDKSLSRANEIISEWKEENTATV